MKKIYFSYLVKVYLGPHCEILSLNYHIYVNICTYFCKSPQIPSQIRRVWVVTLLLLNFLICFSNQTWNTVEHSFYILPLIAFLPSSFPTNTTLLQKAITSCLDWYNCLLDALLMSSLTNLNFICTNHSFENADLNLFMSFSA